MKNIHSIETDKPSRLHITGSLNLYPNGVLRKPQGLCKNQHIYITSDEEISISDYITDGYRVWKWKDDSSLLGRKKIILTTDQDLIKDSIQPIDDEFLEWFVKNPSCEEVEIGEGTRYEDEWIDNEDGGEIFQHQYCSYKIIIPKEEPTILEEAKQRAANYMSLKGALETKDIVLGYKTSLDAQMLDKIEPKQETLEEAAEIDLTNLCYYDKRNPDCSIDDEDIEGYKKSLLKKNKTCSCDNCFYGRTKLTEQLIWQQERMYSEEDIRLAIKKARDISDGKDCFDAEDISGCSEVCTYGWKFNMSEDLILKQFKKK